MVSSAQPAISQSVRQFSCSYALYHHIQGSRFLLRVELLRPLIRVAPQGDINSKVGLFSMAGNRVTCCDLEPSLTYGGGINITALFQLQAQYLGSPLCLAVCDFHRFLFSSIVPLSQAFLSFESTSLAGQVFPPLFACYAPMHTFLEACVYR